MSGISKIVTIMKKIMKPFVLVAAAAMTLASCQKNEIPAPEKQDVHFTINAGIETKTSIVESEDKDENGKHIYHAQWDGNEELGVLFAAPNAETTASDVVTLTNSESGSFASFQGTVTVDDPAGTFYAFYPAAAFNRGYGEGDARLDLKNVQKPTETSFDPLCDILVAKPYDYEVVDGKVVADGLEFARLMSVLRIDLKSEFADIQNEFVESVSFTAGDVEITGYARIFLDNPKFDKWASNGAQWCTVTANYDSDLVSINGTSNSVYLVIAPVTIPANKDLTFEIKTKNYNISKTIKSPEMKFTAGKVSKINLTIAADNCDKIDTSIDYSGEYLIAGKEGSKWYAAKKYVSGDYLAVSEIEFVDENIVETETISDHYMTITKVVGGDYDGMYTIVDAGGNYLSTSSSSSNNMKAVSSTSAHTYWTIVKDDEKGTYSIVASKSEHTRNDMRFNYNGGTNSRVSCYDGTKTALPCLALFSTSLVKPDTTPSISLTKNSDQVAFDATSYEFTYTTKNITGNVDVTIMKEATMANVLASANNGTVTVKFDANADAEQKTATIVLSYEGAVSQEFVLTQEGKAPETGGQVEAQETLTFSSRYSSNTVLKGQTVQATNFNVSFAGDGTSAQYYTNGTAVRAYAKNTFTVSSNNTIVKVVITFGSSDGSNAITTDIGSYQNGTWTGSSKSVKFTVGGTSGNRRISAITVHYLNSISGDGNEGGETPEPDPTPDPEPEQPGQGGDTTPVEETLSIIANKGTMSGSSSISWSGTSFTCTNEKGGTAIRTSDSDHYRVYANSTLKFTAKNSKKFSKVVITCTSSDYAKVFSSSTITGGTVSVSGSVVTITAAGSVSEISIKAGAQTRINKVVATLN